MIPDALPFLDPAARVEPAPGPRVEPRRIPAPRVMTMFWPGIELSPEAVEANIGQEFDVKYDDSFAYRGRVLAIANADGGSRVTIERVADEKPIR